MAETTLELKLRKFAVKCYCKFKNVEEAEKLFRRDFSKKFPYSIAGIRDKIEIHGMLQNIYMQRFGKPRSSTNHSK